MRSEDGMYEFVQVLGNLYRVCMICGSIVLHEPTHTAWHAAPAEPAAPEHDTDEES